MSTLANEIERYLKRLLDKSKKGFLEIKRNDLAEMFMCVPSQINYVLETRLITVKVIIGKPPGRRGYIRIVKPSVEKDEDLQA